jgi:hypothetical protein
MQEGYDRSRADDVMAITENGVRPYIPMRCRISGGRTTVSAAKPRQQVAGPTSSSFQVE